VPPGALRRLLQYAHAHPEIGLIGPRLRNSRGRTQTSFRTRPTVAALLHRLTLFRWTGLFRRAYQRYRCRDRDFETTRPIEVLMGAALLVRRSVFFELGPWDEDYTFGGEDIDLCTRIARHRPVVYHPAVEITHYGRASSCAHIGYVHTNTLVGITRYLRKSGTSRASLWFYKAALTCDAPLQWGRLAGQYLWRRLRRQPEKAAKCAVALRGAAHFLLQGLPALWRA
jgi:N-acetylglucosaminyl-diphospho-decaprenol L-rhamnosyltransferase